MSDHTPPAADTDTGDPSPAQEAAAAVDAVGREGPVGLTAGTELVGEFEGSGYREPPQLVARADRQLVRLPGLLYLVVKILEEQCRTGPEDDLRLLGAVADAVGRQAGLALTTEHIVFLLDRKLAPLGITTYSDGTPPVLDKPVPFLSLRVRMEVLPERLTWALAGLFGWLYRPAVLAAALVAAVACEAWVFATADIGMAMRETVLNPVNILLVIGLAVVSTAFHEFGHATACRYGGARPGGMGCGIYLVWPAFYTDITSSYRLNRTGRLRTDLGGVYFNGLFLVALTAAYLATGFAPLLVAFLSVNIEIIQQLLPTLRFDGYYIVADVVGIPDLFKYIGPILRRVVLRRPADARLTALKHWPQTLVAGWVLLIVPVLALELGYIAYLLPGMLRADWATTVRLAGTATMSGHPVLGVAAATAQILLLMLPVAGVIIILVQLARAAVRLAIRYLPALLTRLRAGAAGDAGSAAVPAAAPAEVPASDGVAGGRDG